MAVLIRAGSIVKEEKTHTKKNQPYTDNDRPVLPGVNNGTLGDTKAELVK